MAKWDLIITPSQSWWKLNLKEVWYYRDLFVLFVKREIAVTYKQTVLGPLWFFVQPALTMAMFTLIFGKVANLNPEGIPAPLFFLCGIVIWNYFSESITSTANTFQTNAGVYGKVYFPRVISPLSKVTAGLLRFGIQFILILLVFGYYILAGQYDFQVSINLLWIPVLVLLMSCLGLGMGMVVSSLTTKYRDLGYLLTFGVQLLMYASAVIFSLDRLNPESPFYALAQWNPLAHIVDAFRAVLLGMPIHEPGMLSYSAACALLSLLLGLFIFNKVEKSFIDVV